MSAFARRAVVSASARRAAVLACALASAALFVLVACSVGTGEGVFTGSLLVRDCGVEVPEYSLRPTFFGADYVTNPGAAGGEESPIVTIRVQRGSYREDFSDGLRITIYDVNGIARDQLGQPIALLPVEDGVERPVDVTFYAQQSCDSGYPDEFWRTPAILRAISGTITFHALYAPDLEASNTEIRAEINDVEFASGAPTTDRHARLTGFFRFFFQRGAPAQSFP